MRFVPVKTAERQAVLTVHRLREGWKEERTAGINRVRGLLAEFGLVVPQCPEALWSRLPLDPFDGWQVCRRRSASASRAAAGR